MAEPGSDDLLPADRDPLGLVVGEQRRQAAEEQRLRAIIIGRLGRLQEPGADHPDPDETPPGAGPDFDPLPPRPHRHRRD